MSGLMFVSVLAAQAATAPLGAVPTPSATASGDSSSNGAYTYVDLEAGAGYSTNPNLDFGDNRGAGFGRISVHGVHTRVSARTTTVLSAFAQNSFYTRHYGAQQSFDLNARHDARVSEKLRVFGDADFAYDKGGQLDTRIISVPGVPLPPGATQPPLLTPVGDFLSVTGRRYSASAHIGAQLALSAREFLSGSTGIEHSVFKNAGFDTKFTTIPVSIGYDRQISPRTTIGGRLGAQFTDYDGPAESRILTPQLTIQTLLAEHITFSGGIGVSFSAVDDGTDTRHSTGLAANANLCSAGERSRFCGYAAVSQEAATVAGPAKTVSAGFDYSRRLDADQTLQFSISANRYSRPFSIISGQSFSHATYLRAAADYTRHLGNRWFGGANVATRKVAQGGPDPKADVSGSLYIRYRLGDLR
jgi:hypothetical protein